MARKLDNIDLDMIDADRLGYGVQYGRYKADHPFTKEANEQRLSGKKKISIKQVYENTCLVCGMKFTTTNKNKLYCGSRCRDQRRNLAWRKKQTKK